MVGGWPLETPATIAVVMAVVAGLKTPASHRGGHGRSEWMGNKKSSWSEEGNVLEKRSPSEEAFACCCCALLVVVATPQRNPELGWRAETDTGRGQAGPGELRCGGVRLAYLGK